MLNPQKLYTIAHSNPTAEAMFTVWALRERHRGKTDIRRMKQFMVKQGLPFNENDYISTLKELDTMHVGRLAYGARGRPKYFDWRESVIRVGHMGLDGKGAAPVPAPAKAKRAHYALPARPAPRVQQLPNPTVLMVPLASGKLFKLELPTDLKAMDIDLLIKAFAELKAGIQ